VTFGFIKKIHTTILEKLPRKVRSHVSKAVRNRHRILKSSGIAASFLAAGVFLFSVFIPQVITFSYQRATCIVSPQLFPGLFKPVDGETFNLEREQTVAIGKFAIYSHKICTQPVAAPASEATYISAESLLGNGVIKKLYAIQTTPYPQLNHVTLSNEAIPTDRPIKFGLEAPDETFGYRLEANRQNSPCAVMPANLSCHAGGLEFEHNKAYDIQLIREFGGEPVERVMSANVKTLTPVKIQKTSISRGATVYNKPTRITLQANKDLEGLADVQVTSTRSDKTHELSVSTEVSGKKLVVTLEQDLPRRSKIELRVGELRAIDQSSLARSYTLPFTTSGGPKVTGVNIGNRSVGFHQAIVVSMDQQLRQGQDLAKIASLTIGNRNHPVTIASGGDHLVITPSSPLPRCASFTVQLTNKLQSRHRISGDSKWSYNSRAQCYTTFSIGTSVRGAGITGYRFGGGGNTVLFVGGTHGDEANSKHILDEWIDELEANPGRIPSGRTIDVIPLVNPDGYAAGTRTNARNVDLNRNFPTHNWQRDVVMPGGNTLKNGGGKTPLSEPESKALAGYVQSTAPKLTLTYHSQGSVVVANESGNSVSVGREYASRSGYGFLTNSSLDGFFPHDTTGAFEDWMHDKLGRSALLIELSNRYDSDFWRNREAMWHAARIP
jgi:hypothetical protein